MLPNHYGVNEKLKMIMVLLIIIITIIIVIMIIVMIVIRTLARIIISIREISNSSRHLRKPFGLEIPSYDR